MCKTQYCFTKLKQGQCSQWWCCLGGGWGGAKQRNKGVSQSPVNRKDISIHGISACDRKLYTTLVHFCACLHVKLKIKHPHTCNVTGAKWTQDVIHVTAFLAIIPVTLHCTMMRHFKKKAKTGIFGQSL